MTRFTNKVVLVTGAGSGIGEATAKRFAEEGAKVVLVGRTTEKLEHVARTLPADSSYIKTADVSDRIQVEQLIADVIQKYGRLDVLVNNAGTVAQGKITEADVDDWRKVMSTDLDGVFYCSRSALPELIKQKGCIVNVSSVSGLGGDWGMSIYNAAKGAVTNFTRALAMDFGEEGVRVNAVCPSLTKSELTEDMLAMNRLWPASGSGFRWVDQPRPKRSLMSLRSWPVMMPVS